MISKTVIIITLLVFQSLVLAASAQDDISGRDSSLITTYLGAAVAGLVVMVVLIFLFLRKKKPAAEKDASQPQAKAKPGAKDDYRKMVDYIKDSFQKGYDETHITKMLVSRGMDEESVNRAIREVMLEFMST
jgi:hypothetical protein